MCACVVWCAVLCACCGHRSLFVCVRVSVWFCCWCRPSGLCGVCVFLLVSGGFGGCSSVRAGWFAGVRVRCCVFAVAIVLCLCACLCLFGSVAGVGLLALWCLCASSGFRGLWGLFCVRAGGLADVRVRCCVCVCVFVFVCLCVYVCQSCRYCPAGVAPWSPVVGGLARGRVQRHTPTHTMGRHCLGSLPGSVFVCCLFVCLCVFAMVGVLFVLFACWFVCLFVWLCFVFVCLPAGLR